LTPTLETTEDRLLGGRVALRQPVRGLRAAIDPVLLAAGIPARPGDRVLEAGCGAGASFICLAARVADLTVVAIERDPALASLAATNAATADCRATVLAGDVADPMLRAQVGLVAHAFANPPWWPDGTPPPDGLRQAATHADATDLTAWALALAAVVAPGGTVSLLLPAARLDAGMSALTAAACGSIRIVPFWPRGGVMAKRVLLQGRHRRGGPCVLTAGLVLHGAGSGFTPAAEAVLRHAAPLPG